MWEEEEGGGVLLNPFPSYFPAQKCPQSVFASPQCFLDVYDKHGNLGWKIAKGNVLDQENGKQVERTYFLPATSPIFRSLSRLL